jgi:4-hydroxy-tetrahydrodipicolinate reductase
MEQVSVLVNGAKGKMGAVTCGAVEAAEDMILVGKTDLGDDLQKEIDRSGAQVVVDFTHPSAARKNADLILDAGVRGVIGTTGFTEADIRELVEKAATNRLGMVIAPNFAIGVILMMKFAEEASRHLPAVEIIELHHDQKADAPSGTAAATAKRVARARGEAPTAPVNEKILIEGVRGGRCDGVPVHSIRLRGLLAHQEVLLGGPGQILTIRHDTTDRSAFMPGVLLAVRKVMGLNKLVFGLDDLL